jgi:uroporphyrinogen decarboxylase
LSLANNPGSSETDQSASKVQHAHPAQRERRIDTVNTRERFLATMDFQSVDRVPLWEEGYWAATIRRWRCEGLPGRQTPADDEGQTNVTAEAWPSEPSWRARDQDVCEELGFDKGMQRIPLNCHFSPGFETRILEQEGDVITYRDGMGNICRTKKDRSSGAVIVKPVVQTREDWEQIKAERLQKTLDGRLPANWHEQRSQLRDRDFPLCAFGLAPYGGLYWVPRTLMGEERLWYSYYDQPDLVKDIVGYLVDFWVALYDQILSQIDVDCAMWTEDLGYNAGPFIAPATFREFLLPGYKKITGMLRDHGVRNIIVDSDGNNWRLIPLFIEAGVTGLWPMEVAANMDVWEVRKAFPRLQILGGVDKRAVAAGKEAIDHELECKVRPTLKSGGYIPCVDHLVPPDVSWENFVYYRRRLAQQFQI